MKKHRSGRIRNWQLWSALLVLLISLLIIGYSGNIIASPTSPTSTPALTGPQLDATKQAWLDNDQKRMDAAKTQVAQNALNNVPTHVRPPLPTPRPRDTPGPGLGKCLAGDSVFSLLACWGGRLNDGFVYVNSGFLRDDRSQGAIQVFTTTLYGDPGLPIMTYSSPQHEGALNIAYVKMPRVTLLAPHSDRPTTMFVFNLQTRQWEGTADNPCQIYPLAFRADTFTGVPAGEVKQQIPLANTGATGNAGSGLSSYAWLAFNRTGSGNNNSSLAAPGEDVSYTNPDNVNDHTPSVGDWIQGQTNIGSDSATESSLDFLETSGFIVPVPLWDQASGQGANLKYHISGFAWVMGSQHIAFPPTNLSIRYWGPAACSEK